MGCDFPFIYSGVLYEGCTDVGHDQPWCTATDNAYNYNGNWQNCKDCKEPRVSDADMAAAAAYMASRG